MSLVNSHGVSFVAEGILVSEIQRLFVHLNVTEVFYHSRKDNFSNIESGVPSKLLTPLLDLLFNGDSFVYLEDGSPWLIDCINQDLSVIPNSQSLLH